RKYICIVMLSGQLCRIWLAAHYAADSLYFVSCQGNPDTGSANEDSSLYLAGCHSLRYFCAIDRIIAALCRVRSVVNDLMSHFFQKLFDLQLHLQSRMIISDPYLHILPPKPPPGYDDPGDTAFFPDYSLI